MRDTSGLIKCVEVSLLISKLQQQEVSTIYTIYGASRTKYAEGLNVYVLMMKVSGIRVWQTWSDRLGIECSITMPPVSPHKNSKWSVSIIWLQSLQLLGLTKSEAPHILHSSTLVVCTCSSTWLPSFWLPVIVVKMYALNALTLYQPVTVFAVMVSHKHMNTNSRGELIVGVSIVDMLFCFLKQFDKDPMGNYNPVHMNSFDPHTIVKLQFVLICSPIRSFLNSGCFPVMHCYSMPHLL